MHLTTLESVAVIVGVVIGILGFLGGLATLLGGNYRVARNAKIVADYEAGYKGLEAKAKGQEQQIGELQREAGEKDTKIADLEHQLTDMQGRMSVLQEVVTGKSALEELTRQLAAVTTAMDRRAETISSRIGETQALVGDLRRELREGQKEILAAVVTPGGGV